MAETKDGLEGVLKFIAGQAGTASAANGSTLGYCTGFSYDVTDSPKHIFDGTAYAHSKCGRVMGKASAKHLFVNDAVYGTLTGTNASYTKVRHYIELQVNGLVGTAEEVYSFEDCVLENTSRAHPEEGSVTEDFGFFFAKYRKLTPANKLIN
jgi:hypothetical protein